MAELLARTTGVLFRLARTPVDPLHFARRLEDDFASPDGRRTTHPTPKGYTPPRPTPEGWARPRPTPKGWLYLIQTTDDGSRLTRYSEADSVSPDKPCPVNPHDDGYRVRQDVRVNHSVRRHALHHSVRRRALHPCKEVPSGCDRTSAGTSPQAW